MSDTILFSEQTRLLALIMGCAVLWSLESVLPLYVYEKNRLRRALPNIMLTVLLVLTNLVLSFATVGVSNFLVNRKLRPIVSVAMLPTWLTALLGIMVLDFFTYLAHVA